MIIGICGGTGSGKSTVAKKVLESVDCNHVAVLQHDSYYRNLGDMPLELRHNINFDHPDSLDNDLFINHIEALRTGESIEQPTYDFTTHSRASQTLRIEPKPVIIIEGILIFENPKLRSLMDIKIFVDTAGDLRFIRRLERDVRERGRTPDSVIKQYLSTVRPMHDQFVEPSKRHADVIIPEGGFNQVGIDLIIGKINAKIAEAIAARKGGAAVG
ncbi:MAG TPA: uridine kinase [Blastocatellia bacterium]|nr:uridine kinase [Blastocatellia bacterium]